jgi:asparagine synthase (glutamine-hydrolysing)
MCGIAGFVNYHTSANEAALLIQKMLTRIGHRGPDECGFTLHEGASLGNVRLSIVDIKSGQQPMSDDDNRYWIAYNGEVFNFPELREELVKNGCKFNTHCDTEVVLQLYRFYGPECLSRLNGQFAISIYDTQTKELFLARDRVGIRPLYYSQVGQSFVFGSEIKALFEFPGIRKELSAKGLRQVFTFWVTLSPQTVFEEVWEVPPGHYLLYKDGEITVKSYWTLHFARNGEYFKGSIKDAEEKLEALLTDAVALRLRADVQVAAYLSGGIDSSVITSLVKKVAPGALNTFSIGFEDAAFDETGFQQEVADFFATRHQAVTCKSTDIAEWFPRVVWHSEMPLLRTSPAPMMGLSKLVRDNGIKVVLTGEGADEALGGYNIFKEAIIRQFWARQPQSKFRPLLLRRLYPYINALQSASPMVLKMFFGYKLSDTASPVYSHLLRWNNTGNLKKFFSSTINAKTEGYDPVDEYLNQLDNKLDGYSTLAKAQYIESALFMSGYLLSAQGDRVAMANSVEGRYPFLDYRVLEFCATLPDDYKIHGLNEKYLLKKFATNKIPQSVIDRSKQAYRAPIHQAFLGKNQPAYVRELLSKPAIERAGIFNWDSVERLVDQVNSADQPTEVENMALVGILSTQLLHQQFVEQHRPLTSSEILNGTQRNKS